MRILNWKLRRIICGSFAAAALGSTLPGVATAASGTWTEATGDGTWSNSANWSGGVIADGADSIANISTINVDGAAVNVAYPGFYRNAVQLDTPRTIGSLTLGDAVPVSPGGWEIYSNDYATNVLTLAGAAPTITVNPLGPLDTATLGDPTPEFIDDAAVRTNLAGTSGFTKAGTGILSLSGPANTITGPININAGTVRFNTVVPATAVINIANGATMGLGSSMNAIGGRTINVAPGTTANINVTASAELGRVVADNATLNVNIGGTGLTFTPSGNWNLTGSPTAINVTSTNGGFFRFGPNLGGTDPAVRNFNTNTFVGSTMTLDNVATTVRTNSMGNDINIGALAGTGTAALDGGGNGGGTSTARYHIGQLNSNTTYAGTIRNTSTGSILIDKVGTGTLMLSGNLTYSTTANAVADQRGGVTRVTAGTLKLTGPAAIPGGITDAALGDLYTTIDIRAGATLDVSGTTATYSTAPLQQVIGPGTIVGNYIHGQGRLRPADVPVGNSNTPTPTAGIITFANNVTFTGSGEIVFDMGLNPAAGNDRIQVNGITTVTGSTTKVTPNFLGGTVPTTGTYTILTSTGGLTGSPSGWSVAWPGRGAGPTVVANGTSLQFNAVPVVGGANLNWRGTNGNNWDAQTTQNWRNNDTNANDVYYTDDNVTFADTHTGGTPVSNFTVNLPANVAPRSVTIDSINTYSFSGPGVITGTATFTKRGISPLVMQRANTFSGAASIENSSVDIGNFNSALGTGALTLSNGTIVAANTATAGLTNSGLTLAAGTSNTIRVDGTAGSTFDVPAATGSGSLNITTTVQDKLIGIGNMSAFTGNFSASGDSVTATAMAVRVSPVSSMPNSVVTLSFGASLANRQGASTPGTIALGALVGDSTALLDGFTGGGTAPSTVWQIGNLNTSTQFAGVIADGMGGPSSAPVLVPSAVTKVGTGTLTLSGANTYTGNTTVSAGVLSLSTAFLANAADVNLATGAVLDLTFNDTDVIRSLYINGVSQATGTWGSPLSTATHKSPFFSGTGLLSVSTFVAPPILIGDYSSNGVVDAADYTVWRNNLGGDGATLGANRNPLNMGAVGQADYTSWKNNFGAVGGGAGSLGGLASVPEPPALALLVLAFASIAGSFGCCRRLS